MVKGGGVSDLDNNTNITLFIPAHASMDVKPVKPTSILKSDEGKGGVSLLLRN